MECPNCLQTTVASFASQESSQTVPQSLLLQISTLPSIGILPPASLTSPLPHGAMMQFIYHACQCKNNHFYVHTFAFHSSILAMVAVAADGVYWPTGTF